MNKKELKALTIFSNFKDYLTGKSIKLDNYKYEDDIYVDGRMFQIRTEDNKEYSQQIAFYYMEEQILIEVQTWNKITESWFLQEIGEFDIKEAHKIYNNIYSK